MNNNPNDTSIASTTIEIDSNSTELKTGMKKCNFKRERRIIHKKLIL